MIDIVRCALRPLTVSEFYCIFLNAHKADLRYLIEPIESASDHPHDLERLLRSRSGGLIERLKATNDIAEPQVQFIHLTVKTWVAKAKTRERISKDLALRSTSYEYYSRYCVSWLNSRLSPEKRMMMLESEAGLVSLEEEFLEHSAVAEHETNAAQTEILIQAKDQAIRLLYSSIMWEGEMRREIIENLLSFAVVAELENFWQNIKLYTPHPKGSSSLHFVSRSSCLAHILYIAVTPLVVDE